MKMCPQHAELCENAVRDVGLWELIDKCEFFNPLIALESHLCCAALQSLGTYLAEQSEDKKNEGHFCPLCECERKMEGFDGSAEVARLTCDMAQWARKEGMIPRLN